MLTEDMIAQERQWFRDQFKHEEPRSRGMDEKTIDSVLAQLKVEHLIKGKYPTINGLEITEIEESDLDAPESQQKVELGTATLVRPIGEYKRSELVKFEKALVYGGQEVRTPHSLKQVRFELLRRKVGSVDGLKVLRKIIKLCLLSRDQRTSHWELFNALWPTECFDGFGENSKIANALLAAALSCVEYNLPQLTALVVIKKGRQLSKRDIRRIHQAVVYLGRDFSADSAAYMHEQAQQSGHFVHNMFHAMVCVYVNEPIRL